MSIKELSENLGLDEEVYVEVLALFLETSLSDLDKMASAIREGSPDRFADAAHSIKGAAANLGLKELSDLAKDAEMKGRIHSLDGVGQVMDSLREKLDVVRADMEH
jgi:HPt (histidine-containing phosphotransfer) domain-containing protein